MAITIITKRSETLSGGIKNTPEPLVLEDTSDELLENTQLSLPEINPVSNTQTLFQSMTMKEHYNLYGCLSEEQTREVIDKYSDVADNRSKLLDAYNLISEVLGVFPDATSIPKILAKNDNSLVHTLEVFEIKLKRALALVDSMVI